MANIGYLTTFSEFIEKYNVEIPRIQRDYTYGSETEKTKKVLKKMLDDIYHALKTGDELILNFVYGCENESFNPLDGQQRLTTLYLIYFFAACKCGMKIDKSFKYATRDDSTIFCNELIKFEYIADGSEISEQITDSAFFRPSFNDDPSIRSMLVVLNKIEDKFADMVTPEDPSYLWKKITENCPVKFYCLDFEKFALSDDLYIKMNSRGKQLTDYEIFKAQFEKYIEQELNDKNLKYEIARLFDNDYTDLVWESQNRDKSKIDTAFLNLFKNLFTLINYVNKEGLVALDWNKSLFENIKLLNLNTDDISFITCFLDHFRYIQTDCPTFFDDHFYKSDMILASEDKQGKIRFFKSSEKVFCDACESILKNPQLVSLYALYVAIKNHKQKLDWFDNFRHVRNLIEFSDDELGHSDRLHNIFIEIENIIAGRIAEINSKDSKFNTTQYSEELVKNKNIDVWKGLFEYENHDILRGSLTLFAHPNDFSLENSITAYTVSNRLEKFAKVFDNNSKGNDQLIRAYLLSIGDFSQQHNMNVDNRMVGRQYNSWRIIFTKNSYYASDSIKIMSVLDKVDITKSLVVEPLSMDNWRYYATCDKYRALTYASYNEAKYGYYYFKDLSKPLEVWLLQSTSCSENNVMWKLLNNLLYNNLLNNYSSKGLTATYGKYQEDHTVRINGVFTIDALQEGWLINDNSDEQIIMKWLESNININNSLIPYTSNVDHIEEMSSIMKRMIDDGLFKKLINN